MWERGKPLPPLPQGMPGPGMDRDRRGPPPGIRMPGGPLPVLHKTDSAYKVGMSWLVALRRAQRSTHAERVLHIAQVGRTITDDPEEEKAQKALKSLLNKITLDNFDRITGQVRAKQLAYVLFFSSAAATPRFGTLVLRMSADNASAHDADCGHDQRTQEGQHSAWLH